MRILKLLPIFLIMASCAEVEPVPSPEKIDVDTQWPDSDFAWRAGDCISLNGTASLPLGEGVEGSSAAFEFSAIPESDLYVAFPSSAISFYGDGKATLTIPVSQKCSAAGYDRSAGIMMGCGDNSGVTLCPAVSFVSVKVESEKLIKSVKLESVFPNIKLSGIFSTDFRMNYPSSGMSYSHVEMISKNGLGSGSEFVLALNPCDLRDGIRCIVTDIDGDTMTQYLYPETVFSPGLRYEFQLVFEADAIIDPGQPSAGANQLTVASCNLLRPSGRRYEMSLDRKLVRDALVASIALTGADLIAFNEVDDTYISGGKYDLRSMCGQAIPGTWVWRLDWPNAIKSPGSVSYSYANGFAYNSKVLALDMSTMVWLAKSSEDWFTNSYAAYQKAGNPDRTCIAVRFQHIPSGKRFWFFVTHLPTESQGGGYTMAGGLNLYALSMAGSMPRILAGDMNSGPEGSNSYPYERLKTTWKDAWETVGEKGELGMYEDYQGTLSGSSASYWYTCDVFTHNHPERRIDHLMSGGSVHAVSYRTIRSLYGFRGKAWCPSDHLPVVATYEFD